MPVQSCVTIRTVAFHRITKHIGFVFETKLRIHALSIVTPHTFPHHSRYKTAREHIGVPRYIADGFGHDNKFWCRVFVELEQGSDERKVDSTAFGSPLCSPRLKLFREEELPGNHFLTR